MKPGVLILALAVIWAGRTIEQKFEEKLHRKGKLKFRGSKLAHLSLTPLTKSTEDLDPAPELKFQSIAGDSEVMFPIEINRSPKKQSKGKKTLADRRLQWNDWRSLRGFRPDWSDTFGEVTRFTHFFPRKSTSFFSGYNRLQKSLRKELRRERERRVMREFIRQVIDFYPDESFHYRRVSHHIGNRSPFNNYPSRFLQTSETSETSNAEENPSFESINWADHPDLKDLPRQVFHGEKPAGEIPMLSFPFPSLKKPLEKEAKTDQKFAST